MGCDGVGEGSLCKVDEAAAFSKEVKTEDRLYFFSIFARFFPQYASKRMRQWKVNRWVALHGQWWKVN